MYITISKTVILLIPFRQGTLHRLFFFFCPTYILSSLLKTACNYLSVFIVTHILLIYSTILTGALRGFDIPFLLTSGGPGNASELLSTYMYKKAFSNNQYGYGSALAVFIIIESMLVVFILRKIFSERKECKES